MKNIIRRMRPFNALCRLCEYQSTDMCDGCLDNNLSEFAPKLLPFALLRTFSMDEYAELPNGAKGKLLAYYIIQIMEVMNGRETVESERSGRVSRPLKIHPIQPHKAEGNTIYQAHREEVSLKGS